ncbi:MAG TPA: hypothetical protein VF458_24325 [Ktedonobacteraceae bacterium]
MRMIPFKQRLFQLSALCGLLVLLCACAGNGGSQGSATTTSSSTAHTNTATTSPTVLPSSGVNSGPQPCPAAVAEIADWNPIIPIQTGVSKAKSVTCGYLKNIPTLQALVTVNHSGPGSILDVYVYDNLTGAVPVQIFKLLNLSKGDAKVSGNNSVETAEVDPNSSINKDLSQADYTPDLFREFQWSAGAGTLVQVPFAGIFPDLTRYQAEVDQGQVKQGHQPWKLNATKTAQALGASLLHWNQDAPATLVSGGGDHDAQAVVNLKNASSDPGNSITISLARLEQNTNNGIWIVTDVQTTGLSLTQPQTGSRLRGSTTTTGTGSAFEGVIGKVTILDHLYTDIGHTTAHGATGNGSTTFSTNVSSHPTFKGGAQEGLIMLTTRGNASGAISGAIIIKVLLQQ